MDVHFTEGDVFFSLGMAVATERCCHMSKIFQSKYDGNLFNRKPGKPIFAGILTMVSGSDFPNKQKIH